MSQLELPPLPLGLEAAVDAVDPLLVHFTVRDPAGGSVTVDYGDGTSGTLPAAATVLVDHRYVDGGAYTAVAHTGAGGQADATVVVTLVAPPMALAATPEPGLPRLVHFTLTGAAGVEVVVDFGDRGTATLTSADPLLFDHLYGQPGSYSVVASTGGTQADATLVVVVEAVPAIVTPAELEALLGLEPEEAVRVALLVQLAVEAYIWPTPVPDPVPPPMHAVGLALAARFAGAALTKAGAVTGETIGSYSYRLASPLTFDNVVLVLGDLAAALDPWAPFHQAAYDVDTTPTFTPAGWPDDWWQRDLDRLEAAP